MADFYYGADLLPEIPVVDGKPYCFIRRNNNYYKYEVFYAGSQFYYDNSTTALYTKDGSNCTRYELAMGADGVWTYVDENYNYFGVEAGRDCIFANADVYNGASSTDIYLAGNKPIPEDASFSLIQKIEAETGVLTGSAIFVDRAEYSQNVVVDGITPADGTLTLNFTVPYNDFYIIRMYYTQKGERDFKYVINGKTYSQNVVGTSYYEIEHTDFQMYLNAGTTSILFKGGTTTWSPMFDYFEILTTEAIPITKYLVKDVTNDTLYTIVDGALSVVEAELTADTFIAYGVDNAPSSELLLTLSHFSILAWNEKCVPEISASVTATPKAQVVVSDRAYLTYDYIAGIESVTAICEGDLICTVSVDGRQTWKKWNGTEWETVTDAQGQENTWDDINAMTWSNVNTMTWNYVKGSGYEASNDGMSKEVLEAITIEQWDALIADASGMYLRIVLIDGTQSVEEIKINYKEA